jgi:hypothetical protein
MSSGVAIPVPQRYEKMTLTNIFNLRNTFHFQDPIEIWEVGEEISPEARQLFSTFPNVEFKNTLSYDDRIDYWRGYQVKGLVTKYSSFDDYIFCDADVVFLQNPSVIQRSTEYLITGSYMFRDFPFWQFKHLQEKGADKWSDLGYFRGRQNFIKKLLPERSPYFFPEWNYLYDIEIPTEPVQESSAETGVVYINKRDHTDVVQTFYELNENWKETYQYTHGDTAAFWLSFVMNKKPFSLNPEPPMWANGSPLQPYKNVPFYVQKIS